MRCGRRYQFAFSFPETLPTVPAASPRHIASGIRLAHNHMAESALAALLARAALPTVSAVGLQLLLSPALADGAA